MPKFTANLSLLFTELDLIDRFKAAKQAGFDTVEIQFPYTLPAQQIKQVLSDNQLKLVLFNIDANDLLQGGEGLAAVPEKQTLFLAALQQCKTYAEILQPEAINVLPGRCIDKSRTADYLTTFTENLSLALDTFSPMGIKTVFEAINTVDMPDFIIHSSQQMLNIVNHFNHPLLLMQYDIYHMQMMNQQMIPFIKQYADKIGHIQFADVPGRGQPGTGVIDFKKLFTAIDQSDYDGWVGAEYRPVGEPGLSLGWM
ncbi:MAG: TIM barrel protein [Methylococcales bacterium]|nr:TIM barrel protein [Methylococcales bacterium]